MLAALSTCGNQRPLCAVVVVSDIKLINVSAPESGKVSISNQSSKACTVFISGTDGKLLQKLEVEAGGERVVENLAGRTYVVRLQNATVNDVRKITME